MGITAGVINAGETASTGFTGTVWAQGVSQERGWHNARTQTYTNNTYLYEKFPEQTRLSGISSERFSLLPLLLASLELTHVAGGLMMKN